MIVICRIHVRRETMFGGGLMVYFGQQWVESPNSCRYSFEVHGHNCSARWLGDVSSSDSNISKEYLDKVRLELTWEICVEAFVTSNGCYQKTIIWKGSTQAATSLNIGPITIIILSMHSRCSVDIMLKRSMFWHASSARKQGGMCWHQILARYKRQARWPRVKKKLACKVSGRRVE